MKIQIKHRWDGTVLFALEVGSVRLALEAAVETGADLRGADLRGADLSGADLRDADLRRAIGTPIGADSDPLKKATPEESIENLDKVREILLDDAARLSMGTWHSDDKWVGRTCAEEATCDTSHCLAGWLQVCSTDQNVRSMDSHLAGIVQAPVAAKMFFREEAEVLAWITERKYADEAADYS